MDPEVLEISPTAPALAELMLKADRLLKKIEARTAQPDRPIGGVKKVRNVLFESARLMQNYLERAEGLSYHMRDLTFVLYGISADKPDIAGAMVRIEEHIDDLLLQRRKIRSWRTDQGGREGRDILSAIYDHILGEVRTWLETTVATIGDPLNALLERGEFVEPGVVKLAVSSKFAMPPQFDDLEAWSQRWRKTL